MRALASTIGLNMGWWATPFTFSPSIQTSRPSSMEALYSAPVLIMGVYPSSGVTAAMEPVSPGVV